MKVERKELKDVLVFIPKRFQDERGWFSETWKSSDLKDLGVNLDFVQDNHSYSADSGTLRGLHYQAPPFAQDKLVRCTRGSIFDVVVDARVGSPTYGHWLGVELDAKSGKQLLVPNGFLHGFATLEADCEVQYKVTAPYDAASDGAVRWDSLDIDWGLESAPVLSVKDETAPRFADWKSPFRYEGGQ
ncbi:dTDP-4-dehydrorhamnose 3,5-epimerase [Qipengyuania sp. 1XM1-15A]|uniref:dTDP-4-dehydrorhamnose 3,5-epimerase n=1 Tax=Qipengyuania xiamenensis TaxID=2867237 RepID=UPI001C883160|nr:dTDP-4-dehydrorhamnose 3,5-epimerase [Qipengyuania xiamenensis]MBX7531774.1 dTDP-4-dehydrorhamnose 3,5-epimerase [Qipengyuania xiamenensis]